MTHDSERLLHLDTRHRQNMAHGSGKPLFALQGGPIRCSRLRLVSLTLPHSFPTFTAADRSFTITPAGGAPATVTLGTEAMYTLTSLATALANAINAALGLGTAFTVTANTATLKLLLVHPSAAFSITFTSARTADILGFGEGAKTYTSGANLFLASTHVCELATPNVLITSKDLGGSSYHPATGSVPVPLFVIPLTEDAGGVVVWDERATHEQCVRFTQPRLLSQLSFELRSARGAVLEPSLNWSMTLAYS